MVIDKGQGLASWGTKKKRGTKPTNLTISQISYIQDIQGSMHGTQALQRYQSEDKHT